MLSFLHYKTPCSENTFCSGKVEETCSGDSKTHFKRTEMKIHSVIL